uniref:GNAT family N-acetyltransferase n=1 Tax=Thaumasiovibrio occultus TaxID=1891184 RepID=UPI000B35DDB2|nr:GNAT family N-acetyltransferase [Thaumasiovibrio occultus]
MALLLEADPDRASIARYLDGAWCFVAKKGGKVVGVCVANTTQFDCCAEIYNVAVDPKCQQQGIGSALLRYCLVALSHKGIQRVELGTGTFGYQLTYYQRLGFRVETVVKNYFLDNYPEPIFEQGIQHKDMLRLSIDLTQSVHSS